MPMQRILVMGSPGSGKSTFARQLSAATGIPMVSIDALFWKPGWVEPDRTKFRERLADTVRQPRWIMDGNYPSHLLELRRDLSDTVIWFDLPRSICILGVLKRTAKSYGRVRPEMAEGCPERIDIEFFRYVWTFRERQRPKLLGCFEGLRPDQSLIRFTDRRQADRYRSALTFSPNPALVH
jgi:adenylate kinase family enzyme